MTDPSRPLERSPLDERQPAREPRVEGSSARSATTGSSWFPRSEGSWAISALVARFQVTIPMAASASDASWSTTRTLSLRMCSA